MNLIYLDESGNTGLNLKDDQQPIFVLAAISIPSDKWFRMEKEFYDILKKALKTDLPEDIELHAMDLKNQKKHFENLSKDDCLFIRDNMLDLLTRYETPVIYQRIIKNKFSDFCEKEYGPGIKINPYIMALAFVCMEVNDCLKNIGPDELGMLIFDEQKESFSDAEKSLKTLKLDADSILKTTNIIEKGFFVDSKKSFALQLADLTAYYIRKYEEDKFGKKVSKIDCQTFDKIKNLSSKGAGAKTNDILEWIRKYHAV